jgi:hypothetical protein
MSTELIGQLVYAVVYCASVGLLRFLL